MKFEEVSFDQIEDLLKVAAGRVNVMLSDGSCADGCIDGGSCRDGCTGGGSCSDGCTGGGSCSNGCV